MGSVLRRSGVRLRSSLGGAGASHTDLHMIVAQLKEVKTASRSLAYAQNAAFAQDLAKWAAKDDNRAIQDVVARTAELIGLWNEAQAEFAERVKEFRHHFEMILEGEKQVDAAKATLDQAEVKEAKLRKEIKKVAKAKSSSSQPQSPPLSEVLRDLSQRLSHAEREKDVAQAEVYERSREHEVVKLIRVKDGLTKVSITRVNMTCQEKFTASSLSLKVCQGYATMGRKCDIIFNTGVFIAQQIPDVSGADVGEVKYRGSGTTMRAVATATEQTRNAGRRLELPPPYSEQPPPTNPHYAPLPCQEESLGAAGNDPMAAAGGWCHPSSAISAQNSDRDSRRRSQPPRVGENIPRALERDAENVMRRLSFRES
jgi:hypothetical protein